MVLAGIDGMINAVRIVGIILIILVITGFSLWVFDSEDGSDNIKSETILKPTIELIINEEGEVDTLYIYEKK